MLVGPRISPKSYPPSTSSHLLPAILTTLNLRELAIPADVLLIRVYGKSPFGFLPESRSV